MNIFLIWFFKFPVFRYGSSYIITSIGLFILLICWKKILILDILQLKKIVGYLTVCLLIILFSKNFIRISKNFNTDYNSSPWPKIYSDTKNNEKKNLDEIARELLILGFKLIATKGTAEYLVDLDIQVEEVLKVHEGRPNIEDLIRSGLVQLIINTPIGSQALHDDAYLRRAALEYNIPTFTTIPGAKAAIKAIKALQSKKVDTYSLQEIHNY